MAHVEDDLITLELLTVNLSPGNAKIQEAGDGVFHSGYAYASVDQIVRRPVHLCCAFSPCSHKAIFDPDSRPGMYTWTTACKTLTDINKNKDLNERLLERDRHLLNQPEAEGVRIGYATSST